MRAISKLALRMIYLEQKCYLGSEKCGNERLGVRALWE